MSILNPKAKRLGDLPANMATYVCSHVLDRTAGVGLIYVDFDGDLCMLCDDPEHDHGLDAIRLVGLDHVLDRDPRIPGLILAPGWEAELTGGQWTIQPLPPEDRTGSGTDTDDGGTA